MSFVSAQTLYLSSRKVSNGLMIGAEIFNAKTKLSLKPLNYIYEWTLPDISLEPQKTMNNVSFIPLPNLNDFFFLNLKITKPFAKETYSFENQKLFLAEPKIKIVRKTSEGIILPLDNRLKQNDSLVIITKNFASKNLTYIWEFNGVFISNESEILASNLKEKNGTIRARVFGKNFREKGEDLQIIQIEQ